MESDQTVSALLGAVVELVGAEPAYTQQPGDPAPDVLIINPATAGAIEAAIALRAVRPDAPIVCVSTERPEAELRAALAPAVFLTKPFEVPQLRTILAALLRPR